MAVPYGEIIDPSICDGGGVGAGIVLDVGLRVGRRDGFFVGDLVTGVSVVGRSVSGDNDGEGVSTSTFIVDTSVGTSDGEADGSMVRAAIGTSVCGETTRAVTSNVSTETATYLNVSESSASK